MGLLEKLKGKGPLWGKVPLNFLSKQTSGITFELIYILKSAR